MENHHILRHYMECSTKTLYYVELNSQKHSTTRQVRNDTQSAGAENTTDEPNGTTVKARLTAAPLALLLALGTFNRRLQQQHIYMRHTRRFHESRESAVGSDQQKHHTT